MSEYIEREAAIKAVSENDCEGYATQAVKAIHAADVLPRDEAIKMGAELAAMHGSDATSQQLEEAYLKGVEDGMTRRDVRPVVRGKWIMNDECKTVCSLCGNVVAFVSYPDRRWAFGNFCPNCGAMMEES